MGIAHRGFLFALNISSNPRKLSLAKKRLPSNSHVIPLSLRYRSVIPPLWVRFKSVPKNGRKMGFARDLVGNCLGIAAKAGKTNANSQISTNYRQIKH